MKRGRKYQSVGVTAALLFASTVWVGIAVARGGTTPPRDKLALGENDIKQLVMLMDQDKNGKISEQEFMGFMKAEFKRLDKNNSGELDVKELKESQIRTSGTFLSAGK